MTDNKRTISERLASWATEYNVSSIGNPIAAQLGLLMLDTIGVGIAGTKDRIASPLLALAGTCGQGNASALGVGTALSAADAALVNGAFMHVLEYDDGGFGGHPSIAVLPAVLAAAEIGRSDNVRIFSGYLLGLEVFGQLSQFAPMALLHDSAFHPTCVYGLLASTIAAGRVLDLPQHQLAHALCIAAASGAGLTASFGSMLTSVQTAMIGASAIRAITLARAGLTTNLDALESAYGFDGAYVKRKTDWEGLFAALAEPPLLGRRGPTIRAYACCRANHRPIQQLIHYMQVRNVSQESIGTVEVRVNPKLLHLLRFDQPSDHYQSKFSLEYSMAAALAYGVVNPEVYSDGSLRDASIVMAMKKILVIPDSTTGRTETIVHCVLTDGTRHECPPDAVPGTPERPFDRNGVIAKFEACSRGILDDLQRRAVIDGLDNLTRPGDRGIGKLWPSICQWTVPTASSAALPLVSAN